MEEEPGPQPQHPRPKVTNACEACRAAKVRCQASSQLGICRRCLDSKRECIFKTGPRTRRPRQSRLADPAIPRPPPPAGPSKTFTIDIPMTADEDVHESWESFRSQHESFIDGLVPEGEDDDYDDEWFDAPADSTVAPSTTSSGISGSSLPVGASAWQTPPSSVASRAQPKRSMASAMGLQPQFNVDSAAALLQTFQDRMLANFPCLVLPGDATVGSLAKEKPFVLLAILAAASSSSSLQGHSLYDEEFRKILGLKFVAGGERSLELLQGLIIYVAWYPFHLRPKNKQAFQYVRMVVDVVADLELDQESDPDASYDPPTEERLEEIRTYVVAYRLVCTFATTWNKTPSLQYTPYVNHCSDVLEKQGNGKGDVVLAWQVRVQRIIEEVGAMRRASKPGDPAQAFQHSLLTKGMEAEMDRWEQVIPPEILSTLSIRVHLLQARIFLTAAPLLNLHRPKKSSRASNIPSQALVISDDLRSKIPTLRELYELYTRQPTASLNAFSCICWSFLILSVIVGFRMSFALPECPDWDDAAARRDLDYGNYLERMCRLGETDVKEGLTPASNRQSMDVSHASKVVLKALLEKYQKRVARLERARRPREGVTGLGVVDNFAAVGGGFDFRSSEPMKLDSSVSGCPMIDGSLDTYYPLWDETFTSPNLAGLGIGLDGGSGQAMIGELGAMGNASAATEQVSYQDLWQAMTMGWAQNETDFDYT